MKNYVRSNEESKQETDPFEIVAKRAEACGLPVLASDIRWLAFHGRLKKSISPKPLATNHIKIDLLPDAIPNTITQPK